MQVRTFTSERVRQIEKDIASAREQLDNVNRQTEADMWLSDLAEFEQAYRQWVKAMEKA